MVFCFQIFESFGGSSWGFVRELRLVRALDFQEKGKEKTLIRADLSRLRLLFPDMMLFWLVHVEDFIGVRPLVTIFFNECFLLVGEKSTLHEAWHNGIAVQPGCADQCIEGPWTHATRRELL